MSYEFCENLIKQIRIQMYLSDSMMTEGVSGVAFEKILYDICKQMKLKDCDYKPNSHDAAGFDIKIQGVNVSVKTNCLKSGNMTSITSYRLSTINISDKAKLKQEIENRDQTWDQCLLFIRKIKLNKVKKDVYQRATNGQLCLFSLPRELLRIGDCIDNKYQLVNIPKGYATIQKCASNQLVYHIPISDIQQYIVKEFGNNGTEFIDLIQEQQIANQFRLEVQFALESKMNQIQALRNQYNNQVIPVKIKNKNKEEKKSIKKQDE